MSLEALLKQSLALPDDFEIKDEHGPGILAEWDSLAHVSIMTALESEYDIVIDMEDVIAIETVQDIKALLEKKAVDVCA